MGACVCVVCASVCVNEDSVRELYTEMLSKDLAFSCITEVVKKKKKCRITSTGNHGEILSSLNKSCCHVSPVTFQTQESMEHKSKSEENVLR